RPENRWQRPRTAKRKKGARTDPFSAFLHPAMGSGPVLLDDLEVPVLVLLVGAEPLRPLVAGRPPAQLQLLAFKLVDPKPDPTARRRTPAIPNAMTVSP